MASTSFDLDLESWYLDIYVSHRLTNKKEILLNSIPYIGLEIVILGKGSTIPIHSIGSSKLIGQTGS